MAGKREKSSPCSIGASVLNGQPARVRRSSFAISFAFLAFAAFSLVSVTPLHAATFTVNTASDSHDNNAGDGVCADASGFCSLRAAIEEENALGGTSTINLPDPNTVPHNPSSTHHYDLTLGELSVAPNGARTLFIAGSGAGATIINQSDGVNRVFNIDFNSAGNTHVTISGVTISGGHDGGDDLGGAGILAGSVASTPKDTLILIDCAITGNHASPPDPGYTGQPGGGVQMAGGDLTINGCEFTNNSSAASQGGAIAFIQPDGLSPVANLAITGSTFANNSMDNTSPGTGGNGGGAIYINSLAASSHTIGSSSFTGNTATASGTGSAALGGAIYMNSGGLTISGSTFTGNAVTGAGGGKIQGGAIYLDSGTLAISSSRLAGNTAPGSGNGSGIYNHTGNSAATTATNNWWGCNIGPGTAGATGCDKAESESGSLAFDPWIILTHAAAPDPISRTGGSAPNSTSLTASFLRNSNGEALTSLQVSALIGLPITFDNPVNGSLSSIQTTIQASGTATAIFTATAAGNGHADARMDSATVTASVTILEPPSMSMAFNPGTIGLDGTSALTFTISNPALNTVSLNGVAFTDILPAGLTVVNGTGSVCGGTLTTTAPTGIALSGATVAAGGVCQFNVTVTGAASGNYTNTSSNVTSTNGGTGNSASDSLSVTAELSIAFAGNGSGTVISTSPDSGINCIKGSTDGCSSNYPIGTSVTLSAAGDWKSLFTGWSGGIISSANPVTFTLDASKAVTATFDPNFKAKLLPGGTLFSSIQDAYASVPSGSMTIQAQTWSFLEDLLFGNNTAVTLTGGMNGSYNPTSGHSTVKSLTVGKGAVVISNITLR